MNVSIIRLRAASLLILSLFSLGSASASLQASPLDRLWGCWEVGKVLKVSDISGLSSKQEKAIIGRRLVFKPTCARSGAATIRSPNYSVRVLSDKEFSKEGYYISLSQIGIQGPSVTMVKVDLPHNLSDIDFPGSNLYLREKDIVIEVEGDYFVAERAKSGDPMCKCGHTNM